MHASAAFRALRNNCGLLEYLLADPRWEGAIQEGPTPAGRVIDTGGQPPGVLLLGSGMAAVELAPDASRAGDTGSPTTAFAFHGDAPARTPDAEGVVRWRIGPGDHLEIGPRAGGAGGRRARLFTLTRCEWLFLPFDPLGDGAPPLDALGRNPLLLALDGRRVFDRVNLVAKLTRFPLLADLSYDAVRYLSAFFRPASFEPGETIHAEGALPFPALLLEGMVTGPSGTFPAGSVLFPEELTADPGHLAVPVAGDWVARTRCVLARIPVGLAGLLQEWDARASRRGDYRHSRPWVVVIGDHDEAAPDAQTLALNLAAQEGAGDGGPLEVQVPVLAIDVDWNSLAARANPQMLAQIPREPAWGSWSGPPQVFGSKCLAGVVGLDLASYTTTTKVMELIKAVDSWFLAQERWRKIVFRLPRAAGRIWEPVVERAIRLCVSCTDPLDPLPPICPSLHDVLRICRPDPAGSFEVVSRTPYFSVPRDPAATARFWSTGQPWCLATEGG